MSAKIQCHNAESCWRIHAKPGPRQSIAAFEYTVLENGRVACENYMTMTKFGMKDEPDTYDNLDYAGFWE